MGILIFFFDESDSIHLTHCRLTLTCAELMCCSAIDGPLLWHYWHDMHNFKQQKTMETKIFPVRFPSKFFFSFYSSHGQQSIYISKRKRYRELTSANTLYCLLSCVSFSAVSAWIIVWPFSSLDLVLLLFSVWFSRYWNNIFIIRIAWKIWQQFGERDDDVISPLF